MYLKKEHIKSALNKELEKYNLLLIDYGGDTKSFIIMNTNKMISNISHFSNNLPQFCHAVIQDMFEEDVEFEVSINNFNNTLMIWKKVNGKIRSIWK